MRTLEQRQRMSIAMRKSWEKRKNMDCSSLDRLLEELTEIETAIKQKLQSAGLWNQ